MMTELRHLNETWVDWSGIVQSVDTIMMDSLGGKNYILLAKEEGAVPRRVFLCV
jgi:hypothetical protein